MRASCFAIRNTAKKLLKAFGKAQTQHNNNIHTFYHDNDEFSTKNCIKAQLLSDRSPDCGKTDEQSQPAIRPATEKEVQDLLRARDEEWE